MSARCHICASPVLVESYHVGDVRGWLCGLCLDGAGAALAAWTVQRTRQVQRDADMRAARAQGERDTAEQVDALEEQLPLSTRRAMREARERGAA